MTNIERPFAVTLLSVLHILLGVLLVFGGLALLAVRFVPEMFPHVRWLAMGSVTIGITLVVFALIDFILAYSLWTRRRWAWTVSLAFAVLGIILTVLSLFVRPGFGEILALILYLLAVYYLMQPRVQVFFARGSAPSKSASAGVTSSVNQRSANTHSTAGFSAGCCAARSSVWCRILLLLRSETNLDSV